MEHNHFKKLPPSSDFTKITEAVINSIQILRKHQMSWPKIIEMVEDAGDGKYELNESTLKSFVSRGPGQRSNRPETLEALYNFIIENEYKFEPGLRAELAGHLDTLKPEYRENGETRRVFNQSMEHVFGGLLLNWLGTNKEQISKYQRELCGKYYMFRRSVRSSSHIVRSNLRIEQIAAKDISVIHQHYDRNEDIRFSKGFLVPAEYNFFSVLNIENGISIEFLALKKPTTEKFKRLVGFIISINSNGVLVCARVVLLKEHLLEFEPNIRFLDSDYNDNELMRKTIGFLDEDKAMTIPDKTKELYAPSKFG